MGFLFITAQQTEKLIVPDSIQNAKLPEPVEKIANMDLEKVLTNLVSESIWVGLKIVLALAIYMAGRWLIRRLIKLISTAFEKRKVDPSLQIFLHNLIKTISYIILILLIIQVMGINTTSIVALSSAKLRPCAPVAPPRGVASTSWRLVERPQERGWAAEPLLYPPRTVDDGAALPLRPPP